MIDNLYIKNFIIKSLYKFTKVFKFYFLSIISIFLFYSTFVFSFDTTAKSAIVYDETTNSVLFEKFADQPLPPASMSKLMTLLLTFEALQEKRISLSTKFRVSEKASTKGGSTMFLEKNQLVSVEDIIKGRKALFSKNYSTAKRVQAFASNGDFDKSIELMLEMSENYKVLIDLFPENTKEGFKTEALPIIWEEKDAFNALMKKASDDMVTLTSVIEDSDDIRGTLKQLMWSNCKACHSKYRMPH